MTAPAPVSSSDSLPAQAAADLEVLRGLRELVESTFPKTCRNCGRVYASPVEFVLATQPLADRSGLKAARDDEGAVILELFRNCLCGSTLMDCFDDRRDASVEGMRRRERFLILQRQLEVRGLSPDMARAELLKIVRGQPSALIARLRRQPPPESLRAATPATP